MRINTMHSLSGKFAKIFFAKSLFVFFILSIFALVLSGCSSNSSELSNRRLSGIAVLEAPIIGATVIIEDKTGKIIYSEANETYTTGSFLLDVPFDLPADFNIVVEGGQIGVNGPPMQDTLRLEVKNHNHENYAFYLVDPISTLVATYRKKFPDKTYDDAVTAVWDLMSLPAAADKINDVYYLGRHFSRQAFMREANIRGGLNVYINNLVSQIGSTTHEKPCFAMQCEGVVVKGAAGFVAGAVAKGALGYVGAEAAGYVMREGFGYDKEEPNRQGEIINMLQKQENMLNNVLSEIKNLDFELKQATDRISAELAQSEYNLKAGNLINIRAFIDIAYESLHNITLTNPKEAGFKDQINELSKRLSQRDLATELKQVQYTLLSDAPGEKGLFDIWGDIQHNRGYYTDVYPDLAVQMNYWFDIQVKLLNLLMEYYHFTYPDNKQMPATALNLFDKAINVQADKFLTRAESLIYVNGSYYNDSINRFPYKDRIDIFCNKHSSDVLSAADLLIGQILGKPKSMIVRVYKDKLRVIDNGIGFSEVELKLRSMDAQQVYSMLPKITEFTPWPSSTWNTAASGVEVARYIFENIPDGRYSLLYDEAYPKISLRFPQEFIDQGTYFHSESVNDKRPYANIVVLGWGTYYLHSSDTRCSLFYPS